MNLLFKLMLLFATLCVVNISCTKDNPEHKDFLEVVSNIPFNPNLNGIYRGVDENINEVVFSFSEDIDQATFNDGIFIRKATADAESLVEAISLFEITHSKASIKMELKNMASISEGDVFEFEVSDAVRSVSGKRLLQPYKVAFRVTSGRNEVDKSLSSWVKERYVVISDVHMGDERSIRGKYGWFDENRSKLTSFLEGLAGNADMIKKTRVLVAGDLFDEWVAPMDVLTHGDENGNKIDHAAFMLQIAKANRTVIEAFKKVHSKGGKLIYVPGNHDMFATQADLDAIFGTGVFTLSKSGDNDGLGKYQPNPAILVEHGHRYDAFNAPDRISNRNHTGVTSKSMLPPGFFVTKMASTADLESGHPAFYRTNLVNSSDLAGLERNSGFTDDMNSLAYLFSWAAIIATKQVQNLAEREIKVGIDGYADTYKMTDVIPRMGKGASLLYPDIYAVENWKQRSADLKIPYSYPFPLAIAAGGYNPFIDIQAAWQYLWSVNNSTRVVVFGHTHEAKIVEYTKAGVLGGIYMNSGTWIDQRWCDKMPTCTFAQIDVFYHLTTFSLYQYQGSGEKYKRLANDYWLWNLY